MKLHIKVASDDKEKMTADFRASRNLAEHELELSMSKSRSPRSSTSNAPEHPVTISGPFITTTVEPPVDEDGASPSSSSHPQELPGLLDLQPYDAGSWSDTQPLIAAGDAVRSSGSSPDTTPPMTPVSHHDETTLPQLKYASLKDDELRKEDGWTTVSDTTLWYMAGKGPYAGETFMPFPVSVPNDGFLDVTVSVDKPVRFLLQAATLYLNPFSDVGVWCCRSRRRSEEEKTLLGTECACPSPTPLQVVVVLMCVQTPYYKATAYRVTPLPSNEPSSFASIDGEHFKFEPYHVEVHPGLATLLSPYGYYCANFDVVQVGKKK